MQSARFNLKLVARMLVIIPLGIEGLIPGYLKLPILAWKFEQFGVIWQPVDKSGSTSKKSFITEMHRGKPR